jgi:flagellar L-ring protein precursor FlgH
MNQFTTNSAQDDRESRRNFVRGALCGGLSLCLAGLAAGQDGPNSSLYSGRVQAFPVSMSMQGAVNGTATAPAPTNWYEIPLPPPKEVRVHDIITIRVDMGARVSSDVQFQRRRTSQYDAQLNDWIKLDGFKSAKPAPFSDGEPRIQGNLNYLNRVTGDLETTESMKFEIAATVSAVLPNGNLVLEAHRTLRNNNELWMHSLSGICRREDIGPGNVILSKDIANLEVEKKELGHIRDTYKRGWFMRWWDQASPF